MIKIKMKRIFNFRFILYFFWSLCILLGSILFIFLFHDGGF